MTVLELGVHEPVELTEGPAEAAGHLPVEVLVVPMRWSSPLLPQSSSFGPVP